MTEEEVPFWIYTIQNARAVPALLIVQTEQIDSENINYIDISMTTEQYATLAQYSLNLQNGPFLQVTYWIWSKIQAKEQCAQKRAEEKWKKKTARAEEAKCEV